MDYLAHWHVERDTIAAQVAAMTRTPAAAPPSAPVNVVGGQATPAHHNAAEAFRAQNAVRHWAKSTGSDPANLRAALKGD